MQSLIYKYFLYFFQSFWQVERTTPRIYTALCKELNVPPPRSFPCNSAMVVVPTDAVVIRLFTIMVSDLASGLCNIENYLNNDELFLNGGRLLSTGVTENRSIENRWVIGISITKEITREETCSRLLFSAGNRLRSSLPPRRFVSEDIRRKGKWLTRRR